MPKVKYIAEGFVKDAKVLLEEFVKENSPEFSVFTHFWKKHNFAAVYLGRSSAEVQQFTHEIFQLTLKFLVASDIFFQIGGIYLLYALFRNQVIEPPARIRIVLAQYDYFLEMRKLAVREKYKTLHYVIGYLLENGFDLVAHPTLSGPRNAKHSMEYQKHALQLSCVLKDVKENSLFIFEDNSIEEIQELNDTYTELIKKLPFDKNIFQESTDLNLDTHIKNLAKLIGFERNDSEENSQVEKAYDNIGKRRADIKSSAFASKAWFRQLNPSDDDDDEYEDNKRYTRSRAQRKSLSRKAKLSKQFIENEEDEESDEKVVKIKRRRRPRIPKDKRRIGRPRKGHALERLLMEDVDIPKSNKLQGIRKRGPVARSSYLEQYIERPIKEPKVEMTKFSSSSEEELIDEPEEEALTIDLDDDDDYDKVLTF